MQTVREPRVEDRRRFVVDVIVNCTLSFTVTRILELGSGTGLLGMALSKMSVTHPPAALILSDGDDKAIDLLRSNLLNPANQMDATVVKAVPLLWGKDCNGSISPDFLDWCRAAFSVRSCTDVLFDCIVAGDVLYKAELPSIFFETAHALLSTDRSSLWLCHVPRHGVTQECVVEAAKAGGFAVETIDPPVGDIRGCPLEDVKRAVIYRMTKLA